MKYTLTIALFLCCSIFAAAQQKPTELDKSPLDVSYYPVNYPLLKMNGKAKDQPVARVIYSRPLKSNRTIFGGIVKYGELWRLGANESTEFEVFKNIKMGGKTVGKGRYTLYCIPNETKWTIIVNKDNFSWGSFSYNSKKDLVRFDVPISKTTEVTEALTIYFEDATGGGANMVIMWDNVKASIPINL
ncbi:MAG: hypothetical protein K0Q66_395 [Chitinophagaceae bacterium]|jgi:hypothetical protein|nr:hypothetical protein [Chitinophagaceae bacterium]